MLAKLKKGLVLLLFISFSSFAQENAISKFFSKYTQEDGFTNITISSKMFSLFTHFEAEEEEDKEMLETISKLKGLRILAADSLPNAKKFYHEAVALPGKDYEELMTFQNTDEEMLFLIKEEDGKISELLLIVGSNDGFFIMSLVGDVDLKQISRLSKNMNIEGMNYLENLNNK